MGLSFFDFDVIIAYLIPGLIVLGALSLHGPQVGSQFSRVAAGERAFPALFTLALAALVAGMMISIIRFTTVDLSFKSPWPREGSMGELWFAEEARWKGLEPPVLNYGALADAGRLESFQEATRNELRPHQFYGNTLLAIIVYSISGVVASIRRPRESIARLFARIGLWILAMVIATLLLYPASRAAYYRFNKAIDDLGASGASIPRASPPP